MASDFLLSVPHLPGWVLIQDAADELGISRQGLHKILATGELPTVHRLGRADKKPIYVVQRSDLDRFRALRERHTISAESVTAE